MNMLADALALHDRGFAVIPCVLTISTTEKKSDGSWKIDKTPLVLWQDYQKHRPPRSLVEQWFGVRYAKPFVHKGVRHEWVSIGAVTGGAHKLFAIDVDLGFSKEALDKHELNLETLTAKTPSGGMHYYYAHPGEPFLALTHADKVTKIDVRGDGGFIVFPPSVAPDGRKYEWTKDVAPAKPSPATLRIVENLKKLNHERADFKNIVNLTIGGRTDTAISIAGALLRYQPEHQWGTLCWTIVKLWNSQNLPPLDEKKLAQDFSGIAQRELLRRKNLILK